LSSSRAVIGQSRRSRKNWSKSLNEPGNIDSATIRYSIILLSAIEHTVM
jgi:hypothetical protein